jgi:hypothetical protein
MKETPSILSSSPTSPKHGSQIQTRVPNRSSSYGGLFPIPVEPVTQLQLNKQDDLKSQSLAKKIKADEQEKRKLKEEVETLNHSYCELLMKYNTLQAEYTKTRHYTTSPDKDMDEVENLKRDLQRSHETALVMELNFRHKEKDKDMQIKELKSRLDELQNIQAPELKCRAKPKGILKIRVSSMPLVDSRSSPATESEPESAVTVRNYPKLLTQNSLKPVMVQSPLSKLKNETTPPVFVTAPSESESVNDGLLSDSSTDRVASYSGKQKPRSNSFEGKQQDKQEQPASPATLYLESDSSPTTINGSEADHEGYFGFNLKSHKNKKKTGRNLETPSRWKLGARPSSISSTLLAIDLLSEEFSSINGNDDR